MSRFDKTITRTVTIADSATTSDEVDMSDVEFVAIITDSALDTGTITFQAALETGGTFIPVKDASDTAIEITSAAASTYYIINPIGIDGMRFIKLVSATTQTGASTITLVLRRV